MAARPGHVAPEVVPVPELSERALRVSENLEDVCTQLAHRLMDEDDILQAGIVAACVGKVRKVSAMLDSCAAKHNNRLRKDGLHGVREDEDQQAPPVAQMRLL